MWYLRDTHLKVLTDHTTAVHSVNNIVSSKSLSCDLQVRKNWGWDIMSYNFITVSHIPHILNAQKQEKSRNPMNLISVVFSISSKVILQLTYLPQG